MTIGLQIRKVESDWQHPIDERLIYPQNPMGYVGLPVEYKERYESWLRDHQLWREGFIEYRDLENLSFEIKRRRLKLSERFRGAKSVLGPAPDPKQYMPTWTEEEATHYQMYKNDKPVSPVMAIPNDLAQWMVDNYRGDISRDAYRDLTFDEYLNVILGKDEWDLKIIPIKCLALDIGGVFHADVWETVVEHYPIEHPEWHKIGNEIWDAHAHSVSTSEDYWADWDKRLGYKLDRTRIEEIINEKCWVDKSVVSLVKRCLDKNIDVCLVSNNTTFFFDHQMSVSGLGPYLNRIALYLSQDMGAPKTHPEKGGLAILAENYEPSSILFVDDRLSSIHKASDLGMQTVMYGHEKGIALEDRLTISTTLFCNSLDHDAQYAKAMNNMYPIIK